MRGHEIPRAHLAVAKLGVTVDVTPPFDHLWRNVRQRGVDAGIGLGSQRGGGQQDEQAGGESVHRLFPA